MTLDFFRLSRSRTSLLLAVSMVALSGQAAALNHPGLLHSTAELDALKTAYRDYKVNGTNNVYWVDFDNQVAEAMAYIDDDPKTPASFRCKYKIDPGQQYIRDPACNEAPIVGRRAYTLALKWAITEDEDYGNASRDLILGWATEFQTITSDYAFQPSLEASHIAPQFANAAEILRHYRPNSGVWSEEDTALFNSFLKKMWILVERQSDNSNYNNLLHARQEARMAIGAFLDGETIETLKVYLSRMVTQEDGTLKKKIFHSKLFLDGAEVRVVKNNGKFGLDDGKVLRQNNEEVLVEHSKVLDDTRVQELRDGGEITEELDGKVIYITGEQDAHLGEDIYNKGLNLLDERIPTTIYLRDDGPVPANPCLNSEIQDCKMADRSPFDYWNRPIGWGESNWSERMPDGMEIETCRDINHTSMGFLSMIYGAKMGLNQGVDLFSKHARRLLAFLELHNKLQLDDTGTNQVICAASEDPDDQQHAVPCKGFNNEDEYGDEMFVPNCKIESNKMPLKPLYRTWYMAYNQLVGRLGYSAPYTFRGLAADQALANPQIYPSERFIGLSKWESIGYTSDLYAVGVLGIAPDGDADGDGVMNRQETRYGTSIHSADTDGDGMPDRWEIINGLNPLDPGDALIDSDEDGTSNVNEYVNEIVNSNPTPPTKERAHGLDMSLIAPISIISY